MTDIWVCSTCHSINRQRVSRCYKCGGSRDEATGEGSELRVEQALANRTIVAYRSAWLRGLVASILILAVAALGVVILLASLDDVAWMRGQLSTVVSGGQLDRLEFLRRTSTLVGPGLARLGLAIAAVVAFGAWLSRVTANVPALGGGIPKATPTKAFVYPLIPIWNLIKVPGMVQDALYRIDPKAGGFFMLALAWFGLVGSWIISFFAGWILDLQLATDLRTARTAAEQASGLQRWFDLTAAVGVVTELLVAGGAVILVLVMMRIERRSAARDREIHAAALARPGGTVAAPAPPGEGAALPGGSLEPELAGASLLPAAAISAETSSPTYVPLQQRYQPWTQDATPAVDPGAAAVLATLDGSVAPEATAGVDADATTELPTFEGSPTATDVPEAAEPAQALASAEAEGIAETAEPPVDAAAPAEPGVPPGQPAGGGPHLAVVVHGDGRIVATVDADPEQITLEELALVAEALAQAAGTADVTAADEAAAANGALETAARTLRDQGVATTTMAFRP
jgi:Domain of unknown function (DUF4328)